MLSTGVMTLNRAAPGVETDEEGGRCGRVTATIDEEGFGVAGQRDSVGTPVEGV